MTILFSVEYVGAGHVLREWQHRAFNVCNTTFVPAVIDRPICFVMALAYMWGAANKAKFYQAFNCIFGKK